MRPVTGGDGGVGVVGPDQGDGGGVGGSDEGAVRVKEQRFQFSVSEIRQTGGEDEMVEGGVDRDICSAVVEEDKLRVGVVEEIERNDVNVPMIVITAPGVVEDGDGVAADSHVVCEIVFNWCQP